LRARLHAARARAASRGLRASAFLHRALALQRLGVVLPRPGLRGDRRDRRGPRRLRTRRRAQRRHRRPRAPERAGRRTPMTTPALVPATIDYLDEPLLIGEPDIAGPLAVFPLFGPEPRLAYRSFAQAAPLGATVTE